VAVVGALAVGLTACSTSSSGPAPGAGARAPNKRLKVVAAENFWGSLVGQLVGRAGEVTSLVSDPNVDPHDYETSSGDARAFAAADYVVLNGAGYDPWAGKLLSANPSSKRTVLTISDLLGKKEGDNPHFWYDPDYVGQVIDRMEADLKRLDPGDSSYFEDQRSALDAAMAPYRSRLTKIRTEFAGTPVASTESIFVYLAGYLGLNLISPPEFMRAVAEGSDPPAPSVALFQSQISARQARILVYNQQTSTAVTTNLKKLATSAHVALVGVTETIQPTGATFQQWFEAELQRLQDALNASGPAGR
jgi:zinc/manganese transport system substrate-binding protein